MGTEIGSVMTEDDVVHIAITADRLARYIEHHFVPDENILEALGFSSEQIDNIYRRLADLQPKVRV